MIQQSLELSMPTTSQYFGHIMHHIDLVAGRQSTPGGGSKLYVQQAMLTFCQHNEFRKTVLLTYQYFGHILHPSEAGWPFSCALLLSQRSKTTLYNNCIPKARKLPTNFVEGSMHYRRADQFAEVDAKLTFCR